MSLTLVLNLLTIGIFRILRVRYKILDPFSIWIDDESKSLGMIRGITIVLGLLVNILIYVSFTIPPVYYMIKDGNLEKAPTGSMVILTFDICILIFCAFIHVSATVYNEFREFKFVERYEQRGHASFRSDNNVNLRKYYGCFCSNDTDPSNICWVVVCFLVNALVIILGCVFIYQLQPFFSKQYSFWAIILLFIANQGVLIPLAIIFKYPTLKIIVIRYLHNFKDQIYSPLNIRRNFLYFLRRGQRVHNQPCDMII